MNPYQYAATIRDFFEVDESAIIGELTSTNNFNSRRSTIDSWHETIYTMKIALEEWKEADGFITFEYTIPRVDGRVDCIVGLDGRLFVLEFKTGDSQDENVDKEQLEQYVTDLKNFHYETYDIPLIPIWVVPNADLETPRLLKPKKNDGIFPMLTACNKTIAAIFRKALTVDIETAGSIDMYNWLLSPYCPTANIVEAARKLYSNHTVADIKMTGAKGEDLIRTTEKLLELIHKSQTHNEKYLCLVTGVPGAGKTLVGLTVATAHKVEEKQNRSVYLSGNRPLVMVLQEALARDAVKRKKDELANKLDKIADPEEKKAYKKTHKITKTETFSEIKQFIQPVPAWRSEYLKGIKVSNDGVEPILVKNPNYRYSGEAEYYIPYDHVSIYDEAQRAWETKENAEYVRKKESHLKNFPDWSEPRFLISCMDRHPDWAVYICLIGNGQDINHGEAGTKEWLESIKHFKNWKTYAPKDILNDPEVSKSAKGLEINFEDGLHLATDLRSIRADNMAEFVDCLLNFRKEEAAMYMSKLDRYPIRLTRDLAAAKRWVKEHARENERYGALASSKGQRLKPDALTLLPPNSSRTEVIPWFLGGKDNVNSSYYMEEVATEFQVQGLELDWVVVAWDADMRYATDKTGANTWQQFSFRGSKWNKINKEEIRRYQINAYRVILTRARRGMVIYVPKGSSDDHTRNKAYYDGTYQYLKSLGIKELHPPEQ